MLISESRKRPIIESLLYKQIVRFFREEGIEGYFDIVFISIADGIVEARKSALPAEVRLPNIEKTVKLPPKNFRSGKLWIKKEQIEQMANNIVEYLKAKKLKSYKLVVAYVRGSYLEAVRLANKKMLEVGTSSGKSDVRKSVLPTEVRLPYIETIFTDNELSQLKKKGIMWMKVGLRMPTPFIIFRMKIRYMLMDPVRSLARAKGASPEDLGEATSNGMDMLDEGDGQLQLF